MSKSVIDKFEEKKLEAPKMGAGGYLMLVFGAVCVACAVVVEAHVIIKGSLMVIGNTSIYLIGLAKGMGLGRLSVLTEFQEYATLKKKMMEALNGLREGQEEDESFGGPNNKGDAPTA